MQTLLLKHTARHRRGIGNAIEQDETIRVTVDVMYMIRPRNQATRLESRLYRRWLAMSSKKTEDRADEHPMWSFLHTCCRGVAGRSPAPVPVGLRPTSRGELVASARLRLSKTLLWISPRHYRLYKDRIIYYYACWPFGNINCLLAIIIVIFMTFLWNINWNEACMGYKNNKNYEKNFHDFLTYIGIP